MTEFFDAHRPATAFDHDSTLVVAMELSGKSWQLGAVVPGDARRPKRGLKAGDTAGSAPAPIETTTPFGDDRTEFRFEWVRGPVTADAHWRRVASRRSRNIPADKILRAC